MVWLLQHMDFNEFKLSFGDSPTLLAYIEATFGGLDTSEQDEFMKTVDESDFSARQWIEALRVVGEWLDARAQSLSLRDRIGYVCCAAESAASGANLEHLPSLVHEMLEQYGCERAKPVARSTRPA